MLLQLLKKYLFKKKWRKANKHNFTVANNIFPMDFVKVGKMTYGPLTIYCWQTENEGLTIGNYVSIAPNVIFMLGGNHRHDTLSTYPFKVLALGEAVEAESKGPIVLEDDVWIGLDCLILSGVTIGRGAIVAAKSVVTKDVPPYAIIAGNPARVVKYRFEKEVIEKLMGIDFAKIDQGLIERNKAILDQSINRENVNELLQSLS